MKMIGVKKLYELFNMKHYMGVQSSVLQKLSHHFGMEGGLNDFLSSPNGQHAMKMFRKILIDKYGEDPDKPKNPNTDKDSGFFGDDSESREKLVNQITSEIILSYKGSGNV
jgi:hypothetical protein